LISTYSSLRLLLHRLDTGNAIYVLFFSSFVGLNSSHSLISPTFPNCVVKAKVSHENTAMRVRSRLFGTDQPRREGKTDGYQAKDVDGCDSEWQQAFLWLYSHSLLYVHRIIINWF